LPLFKASAVFHRRIRSTDTVTVACTDADDLPVGEYVYALPLDGARGLCPYPRVGVLVEGATQVYSRCCI
jgi:hypothetical protein